MTQRPPTHIRLMSSRYVEVLRAARGLDCSRVPLVAYDGMQYGPAGWADDPGLSYMAPEVAKLLHLTIADAIDLLLIGTVCLACVMGLAGLLKSRLTTKARRTGLAAILLLSAFVLFAGDVYVMNAAPAIAFVPWILYFSTRKNPIAGSVALMASVGLTAGIANFFRSYAGVGIVLFALIVVLGAYQIRFGARLLLAALLLVALMAPFLVIKGLFAQRDKFLEQQKGSALQLDRAHPFWHSVYIGLGYVSNSEIPAYRDQVAAAKVHELCPEATFLSPEYDRVLRDKIKQLAVYRPGIILENVAAKLLVIALWILVAANFGLYAARKAPKSVWVETAFWVAITFNALFGILVVPNPKYILGMIVFATLYGIYSFETFIVVNQSRPRFLRPT